MAHIRHVLTFLILQELIQAIKSCWVCQTEYSSQPNIVAFSIDGLSCIFGGFESNLVAYKAFGTRNKCHMTQWIVKVHLYRTFVWEVFECNHTGLQNRNLLDIGTNKKFPSVGLFHVSCWIFNLFFESYKSREIMKQNI